MISFRNLFNHNRPNNPNSNPRARESVTSSSESVPDFNPESAKSRTELERSAEQQLQDHKDRLTKSLLHNQSRYIGTQEVPQVTKQEREVVYDDINQDPAQTTAYASQIIQKIQMPSQRYGVATVFSKNDSKYARRFLTTFNNTPDNAANMAQINAHNLSQLLDSCPTPLEFDVHKQAFLERMARVNTPEKVSEYAGGLDEFEASIYGKRYEYAEAFRAIQRDAAQYAAQKNYRNRVLNALHPNETPNPADADTELMAENVEIEKPNPADADTELMAEFYTPKAERTPAQPVEVYHIGKAEAKKFLKNSQINYLGAEPSAPNSVRALP